VMSAIHEVLAAGRRAIEVKPQVHDEYAERYQSEISQMVWAHWSVQHSHFKNPQGKVFTLSPWPIPVYWNWTRGVDPADYTIV
jgi:4-hydroxyacetophenone monooxygenase